MVWYKIENKKPIASESGDWDGLRSNKILVCTMNKNIYIAVMYEGTLDGSVFCEFYDDKDFAIQNIVLWTEINTPF